MTVLEGIERTALPTRRTRVASYNFVPRNYLHDPARLDLATWTKTRSYALYDPVADECRLVEDGTAAATHYVWQATVPVTATHNSAFLVKSAGRGFVALMAGGSVKGYVNLTTGAVTGLAGGYTAQVTPVGEYFLCELSGSFAAATAVGIFLANADAGGTYSGTGHQGTAAAGGTLNTLVMAAGASAVDDVYVGTEFLNVADAPGVWHTVTGYVASTKTLTFTPARTTVPDGLTYTVGPGIAIRHASLVPGDVAKPFSDEENHQVIPPEDDDRRNNLVYSGDLTNAAWVKYNAGDGSVPVVTPGQTAPDGTATAFRLQCSITDTVTSGNYSFIGQTAFASIPTIASGVWLKSNTAGTQKPSVSCTPSAVVQVPSVTTEWQFFQFNFTGISTGDWRLGTRSTQGSDAAIDILVWYPQGNPGTRLRPYVETGATAYNKDVTAGASAAADAADPTLNMGRKVAGSHYMKTASLPALKGFDLAFYTPGAISAASAAAYLVGLPWTAVTTAGLAVGAATASQTDEILTIMEASGAQSAAWCHATDTIAIGWHIVQIDWDGSAWRLWLDGAEKTLTVAGTPVGFSLDGVVYLGSTTAPGSFLTGTYGHFAPHSASRSAVEVDRDYRAMKIAMSRVGVEF